MSAEVTLALEVGFWILGFGLHLEVLTTDSARGLLLLVIRGFLYCLSGPYLLVYCNLLISFCGALIGIDEMVHRLERLLYYILLVKY